ncbi:hypothetical protein CVT26_015247 [Gymnopilus dilepis]|uniref:Uncharacterized protein n=1 Tax=Gymnopilus dilepis TaxID=231916 RepID=A0A409W9W9_9AGAR|nr:hypothetical protein CVT26_015247 [Gymnopilus dilepis]
MSNSGEDVPMAPPVNAPSQPEASSSVRAGKRKRSPPPGPEQAESSGAALIRQATSNAGQPSDSDERPAQRPRPEPTTPRTRAAMEARKRMQRRANDWHLKKGEVPPDAKQTKTNYDLHAQEALELHIRALWCLPHQNSPPPPISEAERQAYATRFTSEDHVRTSVRDRLSANTEYVEAAKDRLKALKASFSATSSISTNISRIPEPLLLYAFQIIASFGLRRWAPDVLSQDPDSMYNLLHEYLALNTFEQLAAAHGYAHMGLNLANVRDFALMRKLYRNFIFSYLRNRNTKLLGEAFHADFIWSVKESAGHSDDEAAEVTNANGDVETVYHIAEIEGRSTKYTKFEGEPLPDDVRIDYFEPSYWNNELSVEDKAHYIKNGIYIGMPPARLCEQWEDVMTWKGLSKEEMKEKYGEEVLNDYTMPTDQELQQLKENEERIEAERRAAREVREQVEEAEVEHELEQGTSS